MRRPIVPWMTQVDTHILEVLGDSRLTLSPSDIAYNISKDRIYVHKRLKFLLEAGLVVREKRGYYAITQLGDDFLSGKAKAEDIPNPSS